MQTYKMWIGGAWATCASGETFPTFNPTTGEEIARIPLADKAEIDKAVAAARKAYRGWSQMLQTERSKIMLRVAASFRKNAVEISRLETLEHGSILSLAEHVPEVAAEAFEWAAARANSLMGDHIPALSDVLTYLKREPVGVCAVITPWNHATIMMAVKLAQALTVGNTCIVKPPSVNVKRLIMELGGKNPVIVLEDADIDAAVRHHAPRQCDNAGQHCSGAGRFYIHENIYNEFIEKYVAASKAVVVGDPADPGTFMGPLASREHRDRVEGHIRSGREEGATLLLGGERPVGPPPLSQGFFVMPTVMAEVTQHMRVAREEIFGPVSIFMKPFSSEEEVVDMANDNNYGLGATVWTRDMARGIHFVNQLHAGTVNVNTQVLTHDLPWGGFKESGIGKEGGTLGIQDYTQMKMACLKFT